MTESRPVRILLDVNILVTDVLSRAAGKRGTTSQKLVDAMLNGVLGNRKVQLIISIAMLDTFRDVLLRLGGETSAADAASAALLDLTRHGPDGLDPYLIIDSSAIQYALNDREDAAVMAAAFAARADLLVTDNLADFWTKDCVTVPTSLARHSDGMRRQLTCQFHVSPSGHSLVVTHPLDVMGRAAQGQPMLFDELRQALRVNI